MACNLQIADWELWGLTRAVGEHPGDPGTSWKPSEVLHVAPISSSSWWRLHQAELWAPGGSFSLPLTSPQFLFQRLIGLLYFAEGFSKDWGTAWEEFPCPQVASATWN